MKVPATRTAGRRALFLLKLLGLLSKRFGFHGWYLRRIEKWVAATGLFDESWYLQNNPDVLASRLDPLRHYVMYGDREGRSPARLFDPAYYRQHSSPKCPKIVNALLHYAWVGRYNGAATCVWFDSGFYLSRNRDVKYSRMDPLLHFVRQGWAEGRQPAESFNRLQFLRAIPEFDPIAAAAEVGSVTLPHATLPTESEWSALGQMTHDGPAVVDVIVPVYRGMAETLRCIYSVLSLAQHTRFELIVINDASPEPELGHALAALAARGLFTYLENDGNLGFVRTVNRGMRLHPARDVVLLNADAQPYNDWLDRLRASAYRDDRVATVTPLSNNATICSYPQFNRDNPCPLEVDGATLDAIAREVNAGKSVVAPTGVGFCLYVRRAALDAVGLFDEQAFGHGYGEENDFCQRAIVAGWQNRLAADTYVWHWGSTSFGGTRNRRVQDAMDVLARRYPRYHRDVVAFIAKDPLQEARRRIDEARLVRMRAERNVLIVTHTRGGGTERAIAEWTGRLRDAGAGVFILRPGVRGEGLLSVPGIATLPNLSPAGFRTTESLAGLLRSLDIAELHVHQVLDYDVGIVAVLPAAVRECPGVSLRLFVHDYLWVCPRVNLIGSSGLYCGEPGEGRCNACLQQPPVMPEARGLDIATWRNRMRALFSVASQVVVPDEDVATRLSRYFPDAKYRVRPHEECTVPAPVMRRALGEDAPLRVVVIGAIGNIKGYDVLLACARDAQARRLPIEFTLLGYSRDDYGLRKAGVQVAGRYREEELDRRLADLDPHMVWLPSVWPETYCYTLSPALVAGLPVAAFDLGAIANRLRLADHEALLLPISWAAEPQRINDVLVGYRKQRVVPGGRAPAGQEMPVAE